MRRRIPKRLPLAGVERRLDDVRQTVAKHVETRPLAGPVLDLVDLGRVGMGEDRSSIDHQRDADVRHLRQCQHRQLGHTMQRVAQRLVTDEVLRQRGNGLFQQRQTTLIAHGFLPANGVGKQPYGVEGIRRTTSVVVTPRLTGCRQRHGQSPRRLPIAEPTSLRPVTRRRPAAVFGWRWPVHWGAAARADSSDGSGAGHRCRAGTRYRVSAGCRWTVATWPSPTASTSPTAAGCSPRRTAPPPPGFFTTEAAGLAWLREAGAVARARGAGRVRRRVPSATSCSSGSTTGPAARDTEADLGRALAALHAAGAPCFGREDRRTHRQPRPAQRAVRRPGPSSTRTQRLLPLARLARDAGALPARRDRRPRARSPAASTASAARTSRRPGSTATSGPATASSTPTGAAG